MIAYFDCFSGISGDMIVGALLDAGVPFNWLKGELEKLPLKGYKVDLLDVRRGGIGGKKFQVDIEVEQSERTLEDIRNVIEKSTLSDDVKKLSIKVFERLSEAEGRVHRVEPDKVHFHEVGGVDSIIDIVSASLSLYYLGIDKVYSSAIPLSSGSVSSSHGPLPLPVPAVMELLTGVPVYEAGGSGELVTPTGAAFLSVVCEGFGEMRPMRLRSTGYGAGERENKGLPNLLRVMVGEQLSPSPSLGKRGSERAFAESRVSPADFETDTVMVIEANIDDMNPEIYGYVMERLFEAGALDVSFAPLYMKKGRPGNLFQVISRFGEEREMAEILLRETSTIGVRIYRADRLKLQRESVEVQTRFGKVMLKVARSRWGVKAQPEYDWCRKVAGDTGVPLREVYMEAVNAYKRGGYDQ